MSTKDSVNAKATVVSFINANGEEHSYEKLSSRLPRFLEKFPIEEGWQIRSVVAEAASFATSLLQLHLAAINAGKNPTDLGLKPLPVGYIFTAQLIDPNGRVIRERSAHAYARDLSNPKLVYPGDGTVYVQSYKDWEVAETAALQRLVAACGFSGDQLDSDEELIAAGMVGRRGNESVNTVTHASRGGGISVTAIVDGVDTDSSHTATDGIDEPDANDAATVKESSDKVSQQPTSIGDSPALRGLRRQVNKLAKQKGAAVPKITSEDQAASELERLNEL